MGYMSQSRTWKLHEMQKHLMAELNIPVFDVYETTYLTPDQPREEGDGIHKNPETNYMMISWLYPGGMNVTVYDYYDTPK